MSGRAIAVVLVLAPWAASAEPGDVPWYVQRPAERRAKLEWCVADAARQDTRECMNARAAGAVELMTPNHKWNRAAPAAPPRLEPRPVAPRPVAPRPAAPAGKGPIRGA